MDFNKRIPFDKASYFRILPLVWIALAAFFAVSVYGFGYELTDADIPGSLIAGAVGTYLVHVVIDK